VPTPPDDQQAAAGAAPTDEQAAAAALWEALGASFFRLARHTAALKAFERALKLDGSSARLYAVTQSAAVHALLGAPDKAVAGYQAALKV
jgi:tetratricopeptide (TPR) repeat protein